MSLENVNIHSGTSSDAIYLKDLILKIQEWYHFLLSKWLIIFGFGLLGGIFGFALSYSAKPTYTATTTFVLEDGGSNTAGALGSLGGLASIAGIDIGGGGGIFQGDNILELYKSRSMIEKTLLTEVQYENRKVPLVDLYVEFNKLKESWDKSPNLKNIHFKKSLKYSRLQDSVLGIIVQDINANILNVSKPDKKLSIIKAKVKSSNEFFSKAFNDEIVKNVNDFYVQTKTRKSLDNISILQQKTDSVRMVMNGAIYKAAEVSDATPNLNPTRQTQRNAPVQKSQFNAETNKAILTELVKNLELSKISLRKEAPLIQVIDYPIFPLEKDKFGKLRGIVSGGGIAGFLTCLVLIGRRLLKKILE